MRQLSLRRAVTMGVAAFLLLAAAAAIAVVTHGSAQTKGAAPTRALKTGDPDAQSAKDTPGEGLPAAARAAQEAYDQRAYPGDDIPLAATKNARAAYAQINARFQASLTAQQIFGQLNRGGSSVGKYIPGSWTRYGPFAAEYPGVLTFFGADYTASGRTTGMAIDPHCNAQKCTLWIGAAGGGIWRTWNGLSDSPGFSWQWVSSPFGTNAIGTLVYAGGALYAGTGESHASGDSEAGLGIWKSMDGGNTWNKLPSQVTDITSPGNGTYSGDAFAGRAISSIVVDPLNPKTIYVGSARGVRGVSSVTGGATSTPPSPRPPFGLWKSTDAGQTFDFMWNGNGTIRGITRVKLDPSNNQVVYASAYSQGIWRSTDGGATFPTQLLPPLVPQSTDNAVRTEFDVTTADGNTRMYATNGASGPGAGEPPAEVWRTDDARAAVPVFINLTNAQNENFCTGQCWYDQFVYTPAGNPDMVYIGGSFDYSTYAGSSNGRGVLLSTDEGVNWTDMTADATTGPTPAGNCCNPNPIAPHSLHPDQHAIVVNPTNPNQFFEGSDGGVMKSDGTFTDISSQCTDRGLSGDDLTLCQQLLSRVPSVLSSMNKGLDTLQFQSLSINPQDASDLMGGTQDNGTFESTGAPTTWPQIIYGDGGQSGWNAVDSTMRFNSFFGQYHDGNFQNGDPTAWVVIAGPIAASPESSNFYAPLIPDPNPAAAGTIFEGSQSVWRTQDWGGDQAYLEANCPEFYTSGADPACGDFEKLGATTLTTGVLGDRSGCCVAAVERAPSDTSTLWAATNAGRVFISKNVDATPASAVTFTRLDSLSTLDPGRFVSGIFVDPANPNHAWISYSGYSANTPSQPGHVFEVTYDPAGPSATWTPLDGTTLADLPVTDVVYDAPTGDLFASTDFGVLRLPAGSSNWTIAGTGFPGAEVAGLSIAPGARLLYAATHGLGAWKLVLRHP
ncbi:MAG TPA: hypothetical protein VF895_09695 [Gaiellaceae bacterium]